jgi:hypothetical protein
MVLTRLSLLILMIWIPNWLVYAQPGCGLTCINIKEWRPAGQMVTVEIGLLSKCKKLRRFKVSERDSLVTFEHASESMYCKLRVGRKVIKMVIDSLNCDVYYNFSLGDSISKTIHLIPSKTVSDSGCINRRSFI